MIRPEEIVLNDRHVFIRDTLRCEHYGEAKAITMGALLHLFNEEATRCSMVDENTPRMSRRELRDIRLELVLLKFPVGVCHNGYYYCATWAEVEQVRDYLNHQAETMAIEANYLGQAMQEEEAMLDAMVQTELFGLLAAGGGKPAHGAIRAGGVGSETPQSIPKREADAGTSSSSPLGRPSAGMGCAR